MQHIRRDSNVQEKSDQTRQKCPQGGRLKHIHVTTVIMENVWFKLKVKKTAKYN